MRALLLLLLSVVPAAAQDLPPGVTFTPSAEALTFGTSQIRIVLSPQTGALAGIRDPRSDTSFTRVAGEPDLDLRGDGGWLCADMRSQWRLKGSKTLTEAGAGVLEVERESGGWRATMRYVLRPGEARFRREVVLTSDTTVRGKIGSVRMSLPGLTMAGTDAHYSLLANWPPQDQALSTMQAGRKVDESFWGMGGHFLALHSEVSHRGLVAAMECETESVGTSAIEGDGCVSVRHEIGAAWETVPGQPQGFGSQMLCLTEGSWRDTLVKGRDLYELVGLPIERASSDLARKTVFYSAHPGGSIDSGWQDTGGFKGLAGNLPEMKRLGITVLWLLPVWKGSVYAPLDYYDLDPALGTKEELKALVDQAHGLGIKVLGDLIPHGPLDGSGLHLQHRDWVSTNEDGTMQYWWGCLSCDYAHPGWAGYMADHAAYWVREVGLDGYRVDCAMGGPTNWKPYGTNRPTMSGVFGGEQVLGTARTRMQQDKPEALLLGETAGPQFFRTCDYIYDWPLSSTILPEYPRWRADEFAQRLAKWLENEQYWSPRGALYMRFTENHDTVRARRAYGPGQERALMSLCALIPGAPFVYQYQETGLAPHLSRLYEIRRELPEMAAGDADYTSTVCAPADVLAFTRSFEGQTSLVLVNFSGKPQDCEVQLPEGVDMGARLRELVSWESIEPAAGGKLSVALDPFGVAVITGAERSVPMPDRGESGPEAKAVPAVATEAGTDLTVTNGLFTLTVGRDNGGLIKELRDAAGKPLLATASFDEGERRLWLGVDRLALQTRQVKELTSSRAGGAVTVRASGTVERQMPEGPRPLMDFATTYRLGEGTALQVTHELTARVPVRNVLGSLVEVLRFDPGCSEWFVSTIEGSLHDWCVPRWPRDGVYRIFGGSVGNRVWQSRDFALNPQEPFVSLRGAGGGWASVVMPSGEATGPRNVLLKMREGEDRAPRLRIEWLDGTEAVSLDAGQTLTLGYQIVADTRDSVRLRRASEVANTSRQGDATLSVRGCRYELSTKDLQFACTRFGGGRIADLRVPGDAGPMVSDSYVYSDVGIFGERTTPDGQRLRVNASSSRDPDAEMRFLPGKDLGMQFEGLLRGDDARSVAGPPTRYRVSYTIGAGGEVRVSVGVLPGVSLTQAKVFLSQVLALPQFTGYRVNAKAGVLDVPTASGPDRLWQSKETGFGADPWVEVRCGPERSLRASGPDLAARLQNVFLLGSGGSGALFLAPWDLEVADVPGRWYDFGYTLTAVKGGK